MKFALINRNLIYLLHIDFWGVILEIGEGDKLREYFLILLIPILFINCEIDSGQEISQTTKIYSGSYGYNVAYRVDGNKVYSGSYGYNVAYRIDGDKIYSGSYGFDVAYRVGGEIEV